MARYHNKAVKSSISIEDEEHMIIFEVTLRRVRNHLSENELKIVNDGDDDSLVPQE